VHRVLLTALMLDLIEERGEHLVVLHGFIGDLQTKELVGLDIDHGMNLDSAAPDSPLLPHPFAPVGDLDPGTIDSNDDIFSEEFRGCLEREIQTLNPPEKGGIVGCPKRRKDGCKLPGKSLHLAVGHLQEDMNASHPCDERFRILEWPTAFTGIHPGKESIPLFNEVKREIELTALDQPLIIYTPVASVRVRAAPAFFLWHGGSAGAPGIFTFVVGQRGLFNTVIHNDSNVMQNFEKLVNKDRPLRIIS